MAHRLAAPDGLLHGTLPEQGHEDGIGEQGMEVPAPALQGQGIARLGGLLGLLPALGQAVRDEIGQRPVRTQAGRPVGRFQGGDFRQHGGQVGRQHQAAGHAVAQRDIEPRQVRDGSRRAFGAAGVSVRGRCRLAGFEVSPRQPVAQGQRRRAGIDAGRVDGGGAAAQLVRQVVQHEQRGGAADQ